MRRDEGRNQAEYDAHRYDDIIALPHHVSPTRLQMSIWDRSAQFSPFAALTGHEEAIHETARLTEERMELSETVKQEIDECLRRIKEQLAAGPVVTVTFYVEDMCKAGGSYVTVSGSVMKIEEYEGRICLENRTIPIRDIVKIDMGMLSD